MGTRAGTAVVIVESTLRISHVQILEGAVEPGQSSSDGGSTDTEHARDRRDALLCGAHADGGRHALRSHDGRPAADASLRACVSKPALSVLPDRVDAQLGEHGDEAE